MEEYKYKLSQTEKLLREASFKYDSCISKVVETHISKSLNESTTNSLLAACDEYKVKVNRLLEDYKYYNSFISDIN
jgi:hypothetical protein